MTVDAAGGESALTVATCAGAYAVARLAPDAGIPIWCVMSEPLLFIARTSEELSIVCEERLVPADVQAKRGLAALRVAGTIDFSVTGVLSRLAAPLAATSISILAVGTYDTDYLLVQRTELDAALEALRGSGVVVSAMPPTGSH